MARNSLGVGTVGPSPMRQHVAFSNSRLASVAEEQGLPSPQRCVIVPTCDALLVRLCSLACPPFLRGILEPLGSCPGCNVSIPLSRSMGA